MNERKAIPLTGIPELPAGYYWHVKPWLTGGGVEVQIRQHSGLMGEMRATATVILVFGTLKDRHVRMAARRAFRRFKRGGTVADYTGTRLGIAAKR